jgi:hypothetical protein
MAAAAGEPDAMDEQHLGEGTAGVWSTHAARCAGVTADQVRARLQVGEWQRMRPRTFTYGGVVPDAYMRASSVVQSASTRRRVAIAAGRTAARVWQLPLIDDHDPATQRFEEQHDDVWLSFGETTGSTLHSRRLDLAAEDISSARGVLVLSPQRTLLDLACILRLDALVCVLDHVLHHRRMSLSALERLVATRAWCPGAPALRTALALADGRAESPHETLTRLVLLPVLPGLRPQVEVFDHALRVVARLDLGDEDLRLGVESDGAAHHRGRAAQDRRRDARTGWTVERCTWFETRCEAAQLRERVLATAAALRARAA